MDPVRRVLTSLALSTLIVGCSIWTMKFDAASPPQMPFLEGLAVLSRSVERLPAGGAGGGCENRDRRMSFSIDGRGLSLQCEVAGVVELRYSEKPVAGLMCDPIHRDTCSVGLCDARESSCRLFGFDSKAAAVDMAKAWHALSQLPATGALIEPGFDSVASRYLAMDPRPVPGEHVRRFSVQAETAVRRKELVAAALAYGEGLELAPWWPQGRYNRALLMGELGFAPEAIQEMKRYLQLVPDAANARQAQDRIYQWEALPKR
jgi:hypothetical protein